MKRISEVATLKHLLSEALMFVQHDGTCCWYRDPRLGCDCGLDTWGEMTKNAIGFYDDGGKEELAQGIAKSKQAAQEMVDQLQRDRTIDPDDLHTPMTI